MERRRKRKEKNDKRETEDDIEAGEQSSEKLILAQLVEL